jgi:hypothetical protein
MPANLIDPFEPGDTSDLIMGEPSQQLTYGQVEEVINRHDPMGLLAMGAPKDEYKPEIKDLVERRNQNNMALSPDEIRVVFEYWFYPGCMKQEKAEAISKELRALFMGHGS